MSEMASTARPGPAALGGFGPSVAPAEVGMFSIDTSRAEEPGQAPRGKERRAAVRHPCAGRGPDRLVVRSGTESRWARPFDVSVGGVGLLLAQPVTPGSHLTIQMRSRQGRLSPPLMAAVVHARPQEDGTWRAGCAFAHVLGDEELESFL
jgi:hypothetical protein